MLPADEWIVAVSSALILPGDIDFKAPAGSQARHAPGHHLVRQGRQKEYFSLIALQEHLRRAHQDTQIAVNLVLRSSGSSPPFTGKGHVIRMRFTEYLVKNYISMIAFEETRAATHLMGLTPGRVIRGVTLPIQRHLGSGRQFGGMDGGDIPGRHQVHQMRQVPMRIADLIHILEPFLQLTVLADLLGGNWARIVSNCCRKAASTSRISLASITYVNRPRTQLVVHRGAGHEFPSSPKAGLSCSGE